MTAHRRFAIPEQDRARYYAGALAALRFLEVRTPTTRRFGSEADARWGAFRGNLETADRIDVLLRDADAQWPAAFGARNVFGLRAAAEDEAFGVEWTPLEPVEADELWRRGSAEPAPQGAAAALAAVAAVWGLPLAAFDTGAIGPSDRLLVAGPSAIAAVVAAFSVGKDLDWAAQVVCVATPPGHRQLAAVAAAVLNSAKSTALVMPSLAATPPGLRLLLSGDAAAEDAAWARARVLT